MVFTLGLVQLAEVDGSGHWLWLDEPSALMRLKSIDHASATSGDLVPGIQELMFRTTSTKIRNAAALALVDLRAHDAAGAIIEILRRPEMATESGTLLYAVHELDADVPLGVLTRLVEHGSFETRGEALAFLEEGRFTVGDEDEVSDSRKVFALLAASADCEASEAGTLALECVEAGRAEQG